MRVLYRSMVLSTLVVASALAAACGHKDSNRDAFKNTDDLLLPNSTNAIASPQELGLTDSVPAAPAVSNQTARAPQRVATTAHRSTHRYSSGRRSSYGGYAPARQPVVVRHTKRDAIVGAAAGAAIGATVDSHSRIRGAVVGGVLGGVLGGVVGHTVDVQKY